MVVVVVALVVAVVVIVIGVRKTEPDVMCWLEEPSENAEPQALKSSRRISARQGFSCRLQGAGGPRLVATAPGGTQAPSRSPRPSNHRICGVHMGISHLMPHGSQRHPWAPFSQHYPSLDVGLCSCPPRKPWPASFLSPHGQTHQLVTAQGTCPAPPRPTHPHCWTDTFFLPCYIS